MQKNKIAKFFTFFLVLLFVILNGCATKSYKQSENKKYKHDVPLIKKDWKKTLLDEKSSIKAAVQCLEKSALQIILVVNKRKRFIGIITDGDIRRGLLSGLNINSSIKTIINKKSFTVFKSLSQSAANRLMQINNIHQIPILNNNKKILYRKKRII